MCLQWAGREEDGKHGSWEDEIAHRARFRLGARATFSGNAAGKGRPTANHKPSWVGGTGGLLEDLEPQGKDKKNPMALQQ